MTPLSNNTCTTPQKQANTPTKATCNATKSEKNSDPVTLASDFTSVGTSYSSWSPNDEWDDESWSDYSDGDDSSHQDGSLTSSDENSEQIESKQALNLPPHLFFTSSCDWSDDDEDSFKGVQDPGTPNDKRGNRTQVTRRVSFGEETEVISFTKPPLEYWGDLYYSCHELQKIIDEQKLEEEALDDVS
jgi:hypothetical protein